MTREDKIKKRKQRSYNRKAKRIAKDISYLNTSYLHDRGYSLSWGRRRQQGRIFECEMQYGDCEARGYCNGDC